MADNAPAAPSGPPSEEEVLADPRLREALAAYNCQPMYTDIVLRNYARTLQELHTYGLRYEENMEYLLLQYENAAYEHLWEIQHKKLFDLECQWRAELIPVPGAQLTANFEDWHDHIEACRIISPISPDDLALFDAFLAQLTNSRDISHTEGWWVWWQARRNPDFFDFREEDDAESMLSEWHQFYDLHRGTGALRELPDLRGDIEERYLQAHIARIHADNRAKKEAAGEAVDEDEALDDPRPDLPTYGPAHDDIIRALLRRFEPPALLRRFEAQVFLKAADAAEHSLELPLALERLQNAGPVAVPIEANADWRAAIIEAGHRHYIRQLRAALPRVYEKYCQREELGISQAVPGSDTHQTYREGRQSRFEASRYQMLKGRAALGEPEDLNF